MGGHPAERDELEVAVLCVDGHLQGLATAQPGHHLKPVPAHATPLQHNVHPQYSKSSMSLCQRYFEMLPKLDTGLSLCRGKPVDPLEQRLWTNLEGCTIPVDHAVFIAHVEHLADTWQLGGRRGGKLGVEGLLGERPVRRTSHEHGHLRDSCKRGHN